MSPSLNPEIDEAQAALLEVRTWCELHGTMALRTPLGLYYVLVWNQDGEAPMMQFIGRSIFEVRQRLINRPSPAYAAGDGLDPEGFDP